METWVVFAGERGFWSKSGQYTTDLDKAKPFTYLDAVAFCKRRKSSETGASDALPVSLTVAKEVLS